MARPRMAAIAVHNQSALAAGSLPWATSLQVYTAPAVTLPALPPPPPHAPSPSLVVADCDTASAVLAIHSHHQPVAPVAALNFANATQRGGGYLTGARAQEEDLCRVIPALHPSLTQCSYPLQPDHVPATTALICRHPATYALLPAAARVPVVVLTAAALDMRTAAMPHTAYRDEMRRRVRAVLYAAYSAGCTALVLGQWGCGVFQNNPAAMARVFVDVLASPEWQRRFDVVVFAIPRGRRGATSDAFCRELRRLHV